MSFEAAINETNNYYLSRDIAVIYKNQHPFKLLRWIIPNEAELRLWKLIFDKPLLPITLASIRDIMLTLKLKKLGKDIYAAQKFSCASNKTYGQSLKTRWDLFYLTPFFDSKGNLFFTS